ncbi:MAG: SBBP repeat-containing protein [Bryobacteraceae bacterium]
MSNRSLLVPSLTASILLAGTLAPGAGAQSATPDRAARARIDSAYGKLPLQFEANQGQQPAQVRFLSRGKDCTVFLTPDGATLSLRKMSSQARIDKPGPLVTDRVLEAAADLRLKLEGGNPAVKLTGADPLPGTLNYIFGKDPAKWRTNVATYAKVRYEQVYPGIDLVFYGNQRQLEYDFMMAPGATPDAIRLAVEGADRTSVDNATGDLVLAAAGQEIRFHKPMVYQPETGDVARQEVDGRFHVNKSEVTFEVAAYDRARPLVVDPVLAYSTFLGGASFEYALAVTADKQGNAYIAGTTCSTNFPTTAGSYSPAPPVKGPDPQCNFGVDQSGESAFITKLNAAGSALVFSTYLGGSYADRVWAIAVDSTDNVYVGGYTNSPNFPTTAGAFQTVCAPVATYSGTNCAVQTIVSSCEGGSIQGSENESGFVTKLNPTGSALIYSTFIGGSENDGVVALAVNSSGEVYVAGNSASSVANETLCNPNPQTSFAWPTPTGTPGYEGWVPGLPSGDQAHPAFSVFSADGSSLVYSTLYGPTTSSPGANNTIVTSMAVDSAGKAYIGGYTNYSTFPVTSGAYQTTCPGCAEAGNARTDGFVVAFDPSQTGTASLVYSTFLGGNGINSGGYCPSQPGDVINGIAVDTNSNAYVTGATCSTDFPTTHGAFQAIDPTPSSCTNPTTSAFVSKLNSTGATLDYSTFLGGSTCNKNSVGYAVAVNSAEDAFVTGNTFDGTFPTVDPLFPSFSGSGNAVFVSEFNPRASALLFSTLLGADGGALGYAVHADNYGNVYVAGQASSTSYLPTTTGAFQTTFGGGPTDAFALRVALTQADLAVTDSAPSTILRGTDLTYIIGVTNNGPNTADVITVSDSVPAGTTFVSASTTSGSCSTPAVGASSGKVTCTASSLADGAAFTVTMKVKVIAQSGKTLTDKASVSSLVYDPVPANNSATATTTVN